MLAVSAVPALVALPDNVALIVAGSFNVTAPLPFTETAVPVLVASLSAILIFLAVPQFAVVMFWLPSNEVPLIVRAVCNLDAVAALPSMKSE